MTAGRECIICEKWQPIECFRIRFYAWGWTVMGRCRSCQRQQNVERHAANKCDEKYMQLKRKRDRRYYARNRSRLRVQMQEYYRNKRYEEYIK